MTDDRIEGTALTESERADRNGATVDAEQAEVAELRRRLVGMDKMADARTDLLVKAEGQRDQARAEAARLRAEVERLSEERNSNAREWAAGQIEVERLTAQLIEVRDQLALVEAERDELRANPPIVIDGDQLAEHGRLMVELGETIGDRNRTQVELAEAYAKLATEEERNLDLLARLAAYDRLHTAVREWWPRRLDHDAIRLIEVALSALDALPAPSTPDAD